MDSNNSLAPLENDLLIVELDDRLEYVVMHPMTQIGCGAGCQDGCQNGCGQGCSGCNGVGCECA